MAVCEIWDVRGRLDHPIDYAENPEKTANPKYTEADLQAMVDVMEYATNKNKTEQRFFVTGVNCDPNTARDEMMITKAGWNDTSEIVCYHGFQSFKHGEVTPEQAHEVGVKLAERMWGNRFQVIVATHLNTDCLHNHFVVNSVSFADGMHYHDNKANLRLLRQRSDELCREYALSVIEHPSGKKKPYALYQAEKQGRPTRDNVARQAVDEAISKSFTLKDFDRQLAEMGYRINFDPNRKYWTIIGKGWQRPKRLYKLGEEYTNDRIMERIRENSYAVKFQSFSEPQPQVKVYRVKGSLKNARKIGGLRGLYLHYCYKLGILPKDRKQNYARLHYLLKDDLMKMEAITQETRLLCRNHIDTAEQLCSYKGSLETEMSALLQKRKELYSKSRRISGEEKEAVKAELSDISGRLKIIRKEVRMCEGIAARSDTLKEKLQTIRADEHEQQRKELKVFTVKSGDLKKFTQEAKKYGVLYCVLTDRKNKDPNAEVDVIARAEDASKISRIVERFNLASVDTASIVTEAEKSKDAKDGQPEPDIGVQEKAEKDKLLDELMGKPVQKEENAPNPSVAKTEKSPQSELTLEQPKKSAEGATMTKEKPSVREELRKIKESRKEWEAEIGTSDLDKSGASDRAKSANRKTEHKQPPRKKKKPKSKETR